MNRDLLLVLKPQRAGGLRPASDRPSLVSGGWPCLSHPPGARPAPSPSRFLGPSHQKLREEEKEGRSESPNLTAPGIHKPGFFTTRNWIWACGAQPPI